LDRAVQQVVTKAGERLDLKIRPLLPCTGKPIDLSNERIYDLIQFP
jgi:hypothetical protein